MEKAKAIAHVKDMYEHMLFRENKEALETLIPELKESEDERIRKIITDSVFYQYGADKEYEDVLDYLDKLEKQAEQKPFWNPTEEDVVLFNKAVTTNTILTPQERAKLDIIRMKFKHCPYIEQKEQKPTEKQDYSDLNDLERAIHRGFLCAGVENVPVTIIKETAKDCLVQTGLIRFELPKDFEEAVFNVVNYVSPFSSEEELREISHRFAEQLLSLAKEEVQKPTWSEEDEKMRKEIELVVSGVGITVAGMRSKMLTWLKSLRPQQKVEWSEKDEKVYDYLKSGFEYASDNPNLLNSVLSGASDATIQDYRNFIDKLKILRPQPKQEWTEEDSINLNSILNHLKEYLTNGAYTYYESWLKSLRPQSKIHYWTEEEIEPIISDYLTGKEHYGGMIARLRCLKPKSHWKPSEEQMEALEIIVRYGDKESTHIKSLRDLYEQLKKL